MPALAKLEPSSVENLTRCEVFCKRPLKRVSSRGDLVEQRSDTSPCVFPFRLLPGEFAHYFSSLANGGLILLTNFRIFVTMMPRGEFYNMPLLCIEHVECRDMFFLHIGGKDGRMAKIPFENNESCLAWFKLLTGATAAPHKLEDIFAFAFHAWCIDEEATSSCGLRVRSSAVQTESEYLDSKELVYAEFNRLQFKPSNWRITEVNANYEFCPSYPFCWIVPASVSDNDIEMCGRYRSLRRVPAVVWRHKTNGAVLVRSSQPEPGFFGWRSLADENFLQSITVAVSAERPYSGVDSTPEAENGIPTDDGKSKPLLILDARSYTAAWANRAKGGGFESSEYYKKCEIQFLGLPNIHSIRYSFQKFRLAIFESPEGTWFQNLETCQWVHHLCALLNASLRVVEAIHNEGRSVLVHCSDGWDRTTQIVSLAKLLLDPYYRTIKGFRELVEREWIGFGHKFAERLGMQNGDLNQRAPVFLQWLDCVHYLLREYPCSFEFSEVFLVKLAQHAYSGLFGTFLCNSVAQRKEMNILHRTFSVWDYLNENSLQFRNFLFAVEDNVLLSCLRIRDMGALWRTVYCPLDDPSNWKADSLSGSISDDRLAGNTSLFRAHSCDSLTSAPPGAATPEATTVPRRGSDSSLLIHNTKSLDNSKPVHGDCETVRDVEDVIHTLLTRLEMECGQTEMNDQFGKLSISDGSGSTKAAFEVHLPDETCNNISLCCSYVNESVEKPMLLTSLTSAQKTETDCSNAGIVLPTQSRIKGGKNGTAMNDCFSTFNCTYVNNYCSDARRTPSDILNVRHLWQQGKRFTLAELIDTDGLVKVKDSVQQRIQELVCAYEERIAILQSKLYRAQQTISAHKCIIGNLSNARYSSPAVCKPEDVKLENDALEPSSYDSRASQSDTSWEAVEEAEGVPTRWIPDHATQRCMGCDSEFWVINRKHHCRSCGKVFCGNCSSYECPVPEEQLFEPVRVCNSCFSALTFQQKVNA